MMMMMMAMKLTAGSINNEMNMKKPRRNEIKFPTLDCLLSNFLLVSDGAQPSDGILRIKFLPPLIEPLKPH
jgi:hypothetical protein